jgi:hypothetical protein
LRRWSLPCWSKPRLTLSSFLFAAPSCGENEQLGPYVPLPALARATIWMEPSAMNSNQGNALRSVFASQTTWGTFVECKMRPPSRVPLHAPLPDIDPALILKAECNPILSFLVMMYLHTYSLENVPWTPTALNAGHAMLPKSRPVVKQPVVDPTLCVFDCRCKPPHQLLSGTTCPSLSGKCYYLYPNCATSDK